jgi:hypothetical protein
MNDMSIDADGADAAAGPEPAGEDTAQPQAVGMEALSAADYCHLAEEYFFLAAVAKDPEAAAELVKAGDDYLRCAADSSPTNCEPDRRGLLRMPSKTFSSRASTCHAARRLCSLAPRAGRGSG